MSDERGPEQRKIQFNIPHPTTRAFWKQIQVPNKHFIEQGESQSQLYPRFKNNLEEVDKK